MRATTVVHYTLPFIAVVGGALVLLMPRLLNYVVVRTSADAGVHQET
jgi:Protein of unknown function (DUF3096)